MGTIKKRNGVSCRSWIEISESALISNFITFREVVGAKTTVCCVVKANAYGHGINEVSRILAKAGAQWFGVDNLEEAITLRVSGITQPILILGYTRLSDLKKAIENNLSFVVYNPETLKKIVALKLKNKAKIHLKIETGLNRQGVVEKEIDGLVKFINRHKERIIPEGISMHFANIEDTKNPGFANYQLKRFQKTVSKTESQGLKFQIKHTAATAGAILYPRTRLDMVRVGIGLYGLYPSKETRKKIKLTPALSWKSIVAQIKVVEKNESVGYGRTWIAKKRSRIAIIPVGYSDGYDRKLSNSGRVIIRGKYASVVGRIAMNMIAVDVTEIPRILLEDEVTIIGESKGKTISAEEIAEKIGTINYEVVARINPLLPRIIK
jgi:alanine racemase